MKVRKGEMGLAICLAALFGGLIGGLVTVLWSRSVGAGIIFFSVFVMFVGFAVNLFIIFSKKRE